MYLVHPSVKTFRTEQNKTLVNNENEKSSYTYIDNVHTWGTEEII